MRFDILAGYSRKVVGKSSFVLHAFQFTPDEMRKKIFGKVNICTDMIKFKFLFIVQRKRNIND